MKKALILVVVLVTLAAVAVIMSSGALQIVQTQFPTSSPDAETSVDDTTDRTESSVPFSKVAAPIDSAITATHNLKVYDFATDVSSARDLQFSPYGTLLVSETSQGKVVALPDRNNDKKADETKVVLSGLDNPHGLAFYRGQLYVAEEGKVTRYYWDEKDMTVKKDKVIFNLPKQLLARHYTRGLAFDSEGNLYISIGSTCDTCLESNAQFASVMVTTSEGDNPHIFAKGLRNAVFIKKNPETHQIWATEMGRDGLGNALPPDEINILTENGNYGWPYCYADKVRDTKFVEGTPFNCAETVSPIYEVPAHSSPLGFDFVHSSLLPNDWQGDLIVAYHGSNQGNGAGFKVVHQKVNGNQVTGEEDFLTGFIDPKTKKASTDRPVDIEFDDAGNLFVSNDKAGKIYLISQ